MWKCFLRFYKVLKIMIAVRRYRSVSLREDRRLYSRLEIFETDEFFVSVSYPSGAVSLPVIDISSGGMLVSLSGLTPEEKGQIVFSQKLTIGVFGESYLVSVSPVSLSNDRVSFSFYHDNEQFRIAIRHIFDFLENFKITKIETSDSTVLAAYRMSLHEESWRLNFSDNNLQIAPESVRLNSFFSVRAVRTLTRHRKEPRGPSLPHHRAYGSVHGGSIRLNVLL